VSYQDAKERLHNTINNLNRGHLNQVMRFHGNGRGTGIRWSDLTLRVPGSTPDPTQS
jgi:hypothetical protein